MHVLDIGVGVPSTLDFLAQFGGRVFFLDLLNLENESYKQRLADYSGALFDVCLFWDLLHCLTPTQLSELSDAIRPYIYSDTIGHSICNVCDLSESAGKQSWDYRICGSNRLDMVPSKHKAYRTWSQQEFRETFDSFTIKQDQLTRDGCLELLLKAD